MHGLVAFGTRTNDKRSCSELVIVGYATAGVPEYNPTSWEAPSDIIPLVTNCVLEYTGHLKTQ